MLIFAILCLVLAANNSAMLEGSKIYCVKPTNTNVSYVDISYTNDLQFYASNSSYYFSNDTTLVFLPGEHILDTDIYVKYASNLMLTGNPKGVCMSTTAQWQSGNGPPLITCRGEAGIIVQNSQNVTISILSMANCGQSLPPTVFIPKFEVKAALIFDIVKNVVLVSLRVYNSNGYGLYMHNIYGNSAIKNCELLQNKGNASYLGGNAFLKYTNCSLDPPDAWTGAEMVIVNSSFSFGSNEEWFSDGVLASGFAAVLSCTGVNITMDNVTAEGNRNSMDKKRGLGGNVFIHFYNEKELISNSVRISNSSFLNGRSWLGGGLGITQYIGAESFNTCENTVIIENSILDNNTAISGSALYLNYLQHLLQNNCTATITLKGCTFRHNVIHVRNNTQLVSNAGIVTIIDERLSGVDFANPNTINIKLDYVTVEHNVLNIATSYRVMKNSATFYIRNFLENFEIHNSKFQYNTMSAISAYRSYLTFSGNVTFRNNSGVIGGGLILCESSNIILHPNTNITFLDNHALHKGGGIYVGDSCSGDSPPLCFYQIEGIDGCGDYKNLTQALTNCSISVTMVNNTAEYAGSQIYGGNVGNCYINVVSYVVRSNVFRKIFHLNGPSSDLSMVSSSPKKMCFCTNLSAMNCTEVVKHYSHSIYPGENISLLVVIVGQLNGTVPGSLRVNITANQYRYFSTNTSCTEINFTAFSKNPLNLLTYELAVTSQLNSNYYDISQLKRLEVKINPCPSGYELDQEKGICDCNRKWEGIECDFKNLVITRNIQAWIGFIGEDMAYQTLCPYNYCSDLSVRMKIGTNGTFNSDEQCSPNHTGLLCGACKEGFSLSAASSKCISCTDQPTLYLVSFIVGQIVCGIALIALLTLANWTITDGTFSGLLFYANTFKLYMFLFLPHRFNAITVIFSMINLDFHITSCIYNGLDSYMKAWLSFLFPVYVWILIASIIYLSKCFQRIARLLGGNGVKVLATLIELSYTRITQAVVIAISPVSVSVYHTRTDRTSTLYRWVYDPNVPYLGFKHIPLFLTGTLFGVFILAHTLVLLFVQPLQSCSHLSCFSWVAKLKPLIDAYTSPHLIKANCRFWPGLLLTVRLVLVVVLAFNIKLEDSISITAITSSCFFLAIVAWSVGGIYRKTYLNVLNSFFVLNLSVLILARNYKPGVTISYISASLTISVMCFVFLCHVVMRLKGLFKNRKNVIFLRNLLQSKKECSEESDLLASFSR